MKKKLLLVASLAFTTMLTAQDAFWDKVSYKGAFPVTDNSPATDWMSGWSNFDPENTNYPTTITQTVSADITTNTTWSGVILLENKVYVKNNATLTIQPGTIIRGDKNTQGTLIITRGAKINANGTANNPIVFTSNESAGNRGEGDWGGLVILGLAKNNQPGGVANIEGIAPTTDTQFGGNFDNDNSGVLKYVRVEFAGIAYEPNKEINGITFGSVGNQTQVDYVQVSFSGDDSFEWFGGTVNCKHIIAYRGLDDDFDTDFGYRGKVQFGLIIRDKDISDAPGDSNAFESDNDATGSTAQPKTAPIFSNITIVGPKGDGTTALPTGEKFEKAFRLRRNTATSVMNSLVTGWEKGLSIEGTAVVNNVNGDTLVFANNILTNFTNGTNTIFNAGTSGGASSTKAFYTSFWGPKGNDSTATLQQVNWVNLFPALGNTPDARLNQGSVAATGASFAHNKFYSVAAPIVTTTSHTYCEGETANAMTATAATGHNLRWYSDAVSNTYSASAPSISTQTPGTFTYWVSQANAAGDESQKVMISVTVHGKPAVPTITPSGSTSFCTGGSVTLTSSSATDNLWSTTATTQDITVNTTGNYSVTVTNSNGCQSTSQPIAVNVSSAPLPTITTPVTAACSGETITLTASASDSYTWSNGANTQAITVTSAGSYYVTTTNANACNGAGQSAPVQVTFGTTPTANASFNANGNIVTFTNTSSNATSYSWDFGDQTSSTATAPVHAYALNGQYTVTLTAYNGNCSATTTLPVAITVSLEELSGLSALTIYPNPANISTTIAVESKVSDMLTLTIVNSAGSIVFTETGMIQEGLNALNLNTSELSEGLYTIQLTTSNGTAVRKLAIKK